jgi:hypothetical protein
MCSRYPGFEVSCTEVPLNDHTKYYCCRYGYLQRYELKCVTKLSSIASTAYDNKILLQYPQRCQTLNSRSYNVTTQTGRKWALSNCQRSPVIARECAGLRHGCGIRFYLDWLCPMSIANSHWIHRMMLMPFASPIFSHKAPTSLSFPNVRLPPPSEVKQELWSPRGPEQTQRTFTLPGRDVQSTSKLHLRFSFVPTKLSNKSGGHGGCDTRLSV